MKNILTAFILSMFLGSCKNKTELQPGSTDTLRITPPAAIDTLQLQPRPADSLLNTRH